VSILEEAIAGAGVDPRELHAKLMAGRQDDTVRLAQAFEEAGTVARDAYERGRRAHAGIAGGFLNNGGPVLDAGAQDAQAWRLLSRKHSVIPSAELSRRGPLCQGSGCAMSPPVVIGGWATASRQAGWRCRSWSRPSSRSVGR
jgi:Hydrolase N-terminal helical domain